MAARIPLRWWPLLGVTAPILGLLSLAGQRRFRRNVALSTTANARRLADAVPLDFPELTELSLTPLCEAKARPGFRTDPGVSYFLRTDQGSLLFDVAFGPATPTLAHNAAKLGFRLADADALAISHLHVDHMGGLAAQKSRTVALPAEWEKPASGTACYLPEPATAPDFDAQVVEDPTVLPCGLATTGPLARALFFAGLCEEQALVARLKGMGLVVITGCGHPTIEKILAMVRLLSSEPVYAIAGGLHFPLTASRYVAAGIQLQMLVGTGKPPWRRLTDADLTATIGALNVAKPQRVLLSPHDSCDHALARFQRELAADVTVLEAGETYRF